MTPADLKAAREALGLTQRALAERLGVPHTTVWRWETGRHPIQHPRILLLALHALTEATVPRPRPNDDDAPAPDF